MLYNIFIRYTCNLRNFLPRLSILLRHIYTFNRYRCYTIVILILKKINCIDLEEDLKNFPTNKINQSNTISKTKKNLSEYEDEFGEIDDNDENVLDKN